MTVPPEIRGPIARLYLATEWVENLPLPVEAPDDSYLMVETERLYARQIRAVREARAALWAVLGRPAT